MKCNGFAEVARTDARVLILGTLPGEASLKRCEYYAQPRNAFWPIIERLFGISRELPYDVRIDRLKDKRIALWDVCAAGQRSGSLDSNIDLSTIVLNDFKAFLHAHPCIELICFNGNKAHQLFRRRVLPSLPYPVGRFRFEPLPSTSPAHTIPFDAKLLCWRVIADACGAS
jgi:double-stranded uracil-DNA glycosylase